MADLLPLQITVLNLPTFPPNSEFGLQDKDRVLHSGAVQPSGAMLFQCSVKATEKDGILRLTGDFVHGSSAERILYLGLRALGSADDAWIRRWKILLTGITPVMARRAMELGASLACTVNATQSAKVRLTAEGWTIVT